MTPQNPITPPPELVRQWCDPRVTKSMHFSEEDLATRAAQWGADQELEACCEWVNSFQNKFVHAHDLRLVRRPKQPSLKEQALGALDRMWNGGSTHADWELFRRALETIDD